MKKLSLFLCASMLLASLAGCTPAAPANSSSTPSNSSSTSVQEPTAPLSTRPNLMVLSGPTGVGAAKLMEEDSIAPEEDKVLASATVVANNEEVKDALISGNTDISAISTNLAATLSAKTDGGVQVLAVNTLGVLYILEKGNSVSTLSDLAGKTVYATGQGANPEYVLNYLLQKNGVEPSQVDIQWMTPQEVSAKMVSSKEAICMLPVPAATALMVQDDSIRQAISLSDVWDELGQGSLAMGCIVARTQFVEEHPQAVEKFLAAYEQSIQFMNEESNREEAAKLVVQYDLAPNEAVATAAIPQCNLTYLSGSSMQEVLEGYYEVLFQADPKSIGGSMPYDSFYYGVAE